MDLFENETIYLEPKHQSSMAIRKSRILYELGTILLSSTTGAERALFVLKTARHHLIQSASGKHFLYIHSRKTPSHDNPRSLTNEWSING